MKRRWILITLVFMALLLFLVVSLAQAQKPLPPHTSQSRSADPGSCVDDIFEENDDLATAPAIWDVDIDALVICSGDDDWFAIDVMWGVTFTVNIIFTHADGDLDLYLYDADGTYVVGSTSTTDDEEISYQPPDTGTYYIEVHGYEDAENIYDLYVVGSCKRCRFRYQGQLQVEEAPANGQFEFQFAIYDANGYLLRGPVEKTLNVVDGLFTTDLYLGDPVYDLTYLEVRVRAVGEPTWVTLAPRQRIDTVPYARTLLHDSGINGVHVGNAGSYGVYVYQTGDDGLHVEHAGYDGLQIENAGDDGVYVNNAGDDGVHVGNAGSYGVYVHQTSDDGLRVEHAGYDGLQVENAGDDGVYVNNAGSAGLRVVNAGGDGVYANTTRTGGEWGLYTPDKIYGSNLTTSSLSLIAQVAGDQALAPGDVVSAVGLANPLQDSVQRLPQVVLASEKTSDNVVGVVESAMVFVPRPRREDAEPEEETVLQLKLADGPAQPGDYIAMTVLGVADVKIDPDSKVNIRAGQRLTVSQLGGHARNLRTETLNDMMVAEGAPVLGIALANPEPGSDTIPVFVTLR